MAGLGKKIGAKIAELRLLRKLTQAQLAEKINVSVETISRMERGVTFPSLKTIENVAKALDTPLKTFFEFDSFTPVDQTFERELAKLTAFLRTRKEDELSRIHKVLKVVFEDDDKEWKL